MERLHSDISGEIARRLDHGPYRLLRMTCRKMRRLQCVYINNFALAMYMTRNTDIFIWALSQLGTIPGSVAYGAEQSGNLVVTTWARDHVYISGHPVLGSGNFSVVRWEKPGMIFIHQSEIVLRENITSFRWLILHGAIYNHWMLEQAARTSIDHLQWLRGNGGDWSWWICRAAVGAKKLAMLQWLRRPEDACEWNVDIPTEAVIAKHLSVLQWAAQSEHSWSRRCCIKEAEKIGGYEYTRLVDELTLALAPYANL